MDKKAFVKSIVTKLGGPSAVGRALGLSHSAVCQWDEIPAEYLISLETHSAQRGQLVPRQEMRPDLYAPNPSIEVNA